MKESNKKKGNDFESDWVEYLNNQGYWAHKLAPSDNGSQPFDVIAETNWCKPVLFLCEYVENPTVKTLVK